VGVFVVGFVLFVCGWFGGGFVGVLGGGGVFG
jgi:hypothetical protein